jgi:hypothetical protein
MIPLSSTPRGQENLPLWERENPQRWIADEFFLTGFRQEEENLTCIERGEKMGGIIKWVAIIAAIIIIVIVAYSMLLSPILQRGWQG